MALIRYSKNVFVILTLCFLFTPQNRTRYVKSFIFRINSYFVVVFSSNLLQVGDPNEDSGSELTLTGPDHELVVDTTSPPEAVSYTHLTLPTKRIV